jgi:excisionase family DNA binding protein
MNSNQLILTPLTISELKTIISETINAEVNRVLDVRDKKESAEDLLTRNETAKILGVSLVTLHMWVKENKIPAYKINTRVRFKREDVTKFIYNIQNNSIQ